ncbi:hypothetical protein J7I98_35795 [Streptomyces sp. ISL-98]|uniref:hypothetical protein n=1 Tax=Streptomyces sp. ISL-98 TaxID=2819192 RepID=UPI001BE7EEC5|nr:hypothetical protein [Streptomyces sp. ISL-98]MBT2511094.1 hypothetical protein [Streptomyces sp. ISL-98]
MAEMSGEGLGEASPGLFQYWVHSYEEDADGVMVFRPADYLFPPARGRRGLDFSEDGTFIDHPIGRGDAPGALTGRWEQAEGRELALSFPGEGRRRDRRLNILHCDSKVLRIRA